MTKPAGTDLSRPATSTSAILANTLSILAGTSAGSAKRLLFAMLLGMAGTDELVAYGFILPVVLIVTSLGQAMYVATTTEFASEQHAVGSSLSRTDVLHAIGFALTLGIGLSAIILWSLEPMIRLLGGGGYLVKVEAFFELWIISVPCLLVSGASVSLMRLMGRIKTTGMISLVATVIAAAASPLLILGTNGAGLGVRGAALSHVIGAVLPMLGTVTYVLWNSVPARAASPGGALRMARSLGAMLLPVFGANLAATVFLAAALRIVAALGSDAVAAYTVAGRVEQFLLLFYTGIVSATMPQLARSFAHGELGGTRLLASRVTRIMLAFGASSAVLLLLAGRPLARTMAPIPDVEPMLWAYFAIVPLSYAFQGLFILCASLLNLSRRPLLSFLYSSIRLHVITLPCLALAAWAYGMPGFFVALAVCNVVTGLAAAMLVRRRLQDGTAGDRLGAASQAVGR